MDPASIKVDREFSQLCPEASNEAEALLELSLTEEGCREPLILWANHDDTLLDGHRRLRFCKKLEILFKTKAITLEDRHAAINWIIDQQLARRNLNEDQRAYLRGKRYQEEKKAHGQRGTEKIDHTDPSSTAEKLAADYGVSAPTIKRDAQYAEAVDAITSNLGREAKAAILSGESGASRKDIIALAESPKAVQAAAILHGDTAATKTARKKAAAKNPPPLGEVLYKVFSELLDRLDSINTQYGSFRAMLDARKWQQSDIGYFQIMIEGLSERFNQWHTEIDSYVADHETA